MSLPERVIAGAMSGTSADGVDVAIVSISGRGLEMSAKLLQHHHVPYDPHVRQSIFTSRQNGTISLADLAKLGREISLTYARAVSESLAPSRLNPNDLACISAHGQTLFHDPPSTIQWFDPALVAAELGCPVVSDFRRADCAAGGQGAPLVPFADYILFRHPTKNRVLLNIGGIANITWLKAGGSIDEVIAFDTGPGNCVIDYVCRKEKPDGPGYDPEGALSRLTMPLREPMSDLMHRSFFQSKPPKSTDGPAMIELFESNREVRNAPFLQRVSTAAMFTVCSIQLAIQGFLPSKPDQLIVSGGGTKNSLIMDHLRRWEWFGGEVKTTDEFEIPSEAKEAIAFALLGSATLDGVPSNVPSVTGAKRPVVLGSITPKP
jgi:anhydro-N-acetylmuramic acid kinase